MTRWSHETTGNVRASEIHGAAMAAAYRMSAERS
jgi:hypothetical protein